MGAPDNIKRLVDTFHNNIDSFKSGSYNETQVRREFIDPLFTSLGWDVDNKAGYAEAYKDVIHEFSLKTKDVTQAPDYCFRIGGTKKFFVEAKKPSVNVKDDIHPSFQLRRYAWTAKLPLSILTDFEEFAVYDTRILPKKTDKASTGRIIFHTYSDYIDKWSDIESIFSREAVLKGSFDKYVESNKKKKGTAEVDEVFLDQMEEWRKTIAKNIALRNPALTIRELNYAVQKTIDRIIFLRICEDRGIEDYGQLMNLLNGTNVYDRLKQIYYRADEKFNSGLFHFEKEKDRIEPPDNLTLDLSIDDKTIKDVIKNLYYPESPYEFSVLPADILGQVYEQFLGKVIRLTPAHFAVVEDKPEVKKAGGVYYTPTYIVDYIVQNTLGKSLTQGKGLTPNEVSKLRILDPACGSGSFLIGAYEYLLNYHLEYYNKQYAEGKLKPGDKKSPVYETDRGDIRLTTAEKKRILLNNIYGVDIDPQAVEVTKLSLLLKVLEGESDETLTNQMRMFRERALPDLSNNIKCGNSLIGPDFYDQPVTANPRFDGMEMQFLDDEKKMRINVFDWHKEFKEIMSAGGFDVVIGNPPYIRIQGREENETIYFKNTYNTATGNYDIYCLFVEKAQRLLKKTGTIGMIVPHRFFKVDYGYGLRKLISTSKLLAEIIDFDGYMVFNKASINTSIITLDNTSKDHLNYLRIKKASMSENEVKDILNNSRITNDFVEKDILNYKQFSAEPWSFVLSNEVSIWNKLNRISNNLNSISNNIFQGLKTGSDGFYIADIIKDDLQYFNCYFPGPDKEYLIEKEIMYPLIKGGDIKRYIIKESDKRILFPYKDGKLLSTLDLESKFPKTWLYLSEQKHFLHSRESGKMKHAGWYGYTRTQALENIFLNKIITPEYYSNASYAYDESGHFMFCGGGAGGYAINLKKELSYYYVLALLNSKLIDWYLKKISMRAYQTAYMYTKKYISRLPIIELKDNNSTLVKIEKLAIQNLMFHKKNYKAKTPQERTTLQRQIDTTDKQIDQLVYQLYGLTEEEIKIVEGG